MSSRSSSFRLSFCVVVPRHGDRRWRVGAMMFSLFAGLALVVAAVGVFSVVAYLVEQRRQEFAVRVALGALRRNVVGLVLRGTTGVTLGGIVVGSVLAL